VIYKDLKRVMELSILNPILFTLWTSLSATTQQAGKAECTPSSALPRDCGRQLQLHPWTP
jgi:hypothetical protein